MSRRKDPNALRRQPLVATNVIDECRQAMKAEAGKAGVGVATLLRTILYERYGLDPEPESPTTTEGVRRASAPGATSGVRRAARTLSIVGALTTASLLIEAANAAPDQLISRKDGDGGIRTTGRRSTHSRSHAARPPRLHSRTLTRVSRRNTLA